MGVIIDVVLAAVTAGIGWLVWTAVLFTKRQTPAGRLRDKVIVDAGTARLASPGKYVARQVVLVLMFAYVVAGFFWGFGVILDIGGFWINTFVIPVTISAVITADILWIFLPPRRRLIDLILRTDVVEGQGISYLDNSPVSRGAL
jgi:hypothetical protein